MMRPPILLCIMLAIFCLPFIGKSQVIKASEIDLINSNYALPLTSASGKSIPGKMDLSNRFPPQADQCFSSSCVSFAFVYHLTSYLEARDKSKGFNYFENSKLLLQKIYSPYYAFYYNKNSENCFNSSSKALKTLSFLKDSGAVTLEAFNVDPCHPENCNIRPKVEKTANRAVIQNYAWIYARSLKGKDDKVSAIIHRFLKDSIPVVILMDIPENFDKIKTNTADEIWGKKYPRTESFHAMVCVGYDSPRKAIRVINSNSGKWGYEGKIWIPFDVLDAHVEEAYVANVSDDQIVNGAIKKVGFDLLKAGVSIDDLTMKTFEFTNAEFKIFDQQFISAEKISDSIGSLRIIKLDEDGVFSIGKYDLGTEYGKKLKLNNLEFFIQSPKVEKSKTNSILLQVEKLKKSGIL